MKKIALIFCFPILAWCLNQCGTETIRPVEEYFTLCDSLLKNNQPEQAIHTLSEVQKHYPNDTLRVIRSLDITADIYASVLNQYPASVAALEKIIDQYPHSSETPKALFKMGFTYENMMKDIEKARSIYEQFLAKYPDHDLALSVRISLEYLGETEDQILDRLLKKTEDSVMSRKP